MCTATQPHLPAVPRLLVAERGGNTLLLHPGTKCMYGLVDSPQHSLKLTDAAIASELPGYVQKSILSQIFRQQNHDDSSQWRT